MPLPPHDLAVLEWPWNHGFIERCAEHLLTRQAADLPDLSALTVVLPSVHLAEDLRQALARRSARALLLPRMVTLAQLAESRGVGGQPDSLRRMTLHHHLARQKWFSGTALWEICAELIELFDELHERAAALPENDSEWLALLEQAYAVRARQPLRFEAEVVHRLWHAEAAGAPGRQAALALALARCAEAAPAPLFLICDGPPRAIEEHFARAWAAQQPATLLVPGQAPGTDPLRQALDLAWPARAAPAAPLIERARQARAAWPRSPLDGRLRMMGVATLEALGAAVASQIRRWLAQGCHNIALVAADRTAARRARALLERDNILIRDETGWKLSTTRVAALLDALLEVRASNAYHRDLLDLAKSPFILSDWSPAERQDARRELEQGLARHDLAEGLERQSQVLADRAQARAFLDRLRTALAALPSRAVSVAKWLDGLQEALRRLGALPALADDEAGQILLELLDRRREELAAVLAPLTFFEWREWLDRELDAAAFVEHSIDSPLRMTHLAATRLRRFEACVLIGADRDNLAPVARRAIFANPAVRAELGLETAEQAAERFRADLAGLIACSDEVLAVWQTLRDEEANPGNPELSLLASWHELAWGDDLTLAAPVEDDSSGESSLSGDSDGTPPPAPRVPGRLPPSLPVSALQSLLDCPYQFHARRLLGLDEADTVREALEKRDYGEFVHRILQEFHEAHPLLGETPDARLQADLEALSRAVFAAAIEGDFLAHAWLARWLDKIPGYLAWQKAREAEGWRYQGSEIGRQFRLPLSGQGDEKPIEIRGRLDRLDCKADGATAVLDYKTQASASLRKRAQDAQEDAQLVSYVLLEGERAAQAAYVGLDEEKPRIVALEEPQQAAQIFAQRLAEILGEIDAGAALPANGVDAVCAYCEMRGLCRKDHLRPAASPPEGEADE